MKITILKILSGLMMVAGLSFQHLAAQHVTNETNNRVQNYNFKDGYEHWSPLTDSTSIDETHFLSGGQSALTKVDETGDEHGWEQVEIEVQPGAEYTLKSSFYGEATKEDYTFLHNYQVYWVNGNAGLTSLHDRKDVVAEEGWVTFEDTFTVPDRIRTVTIRHWNWNFDADGYKLWWDEVKLEGPAPAEDETFEVTFNVDMTGASTDTTGADDQKYTVDFDPEVHDVYISGTFSGWVEPGENPDYKMKSVDKKEDIYSITLQATEGLHLYNYFFTDGEPGWNLDEWEGAHHREITIESEKTFDDIWGKNEAVFSIGEHAEVPDALTLKQNYPNPFNPVTRIVFTIPEPSNVTLEVYNLKGQHVITLLNEDMNAGVHQIKFDGSNLTSGVYLYRLQTGGQTKVRQMTLIK